MTSWNGGQDIFFYDEGPSSPRHDDSLDHADGLSNAQEMVLAILPIPSAILSIMGSSVIIYIALKSREQRKWTAYTRLLLGLSFSDIVASLSFASATFLRPKESPRIWSLGNDATCTVGGFLSQLSNSAAFYSAMLSVYFLCTARFRLKNAFIAARIEPFMHILAIGFPLITATVGAILGVYADTAAGAGCWVNDYPRNCGSEPGSTGEECLSPIIGWFYFGLPLIVIMSSLIVINFVIWRFVRKQTKLHLPEVKKGEESTGELSGASEDPRSRISDGEDEVSTSSWDDIELCENNADTPLESRFSSSRSQEDRSSSLSYSIVMRRKEKKPKRSQAEKDQIRRLRLVSSQAFLFVASYVICAGWAGLVGISESKADTREEETAMLGRIYPLMVLNAFFNPLQGLFNCLVYLRPKFLKYRHDFPEQSRIWCVKRCVFGDEVKPQPGKRPEGNEDAAIAAPSPTSPLQPADDTQADGQYREPDIDIEAANQHKPLPRSMLSSLTASLGDFESVREETNAVEAQEEVTTPPDDRWKMEEVSNDTRRGKRTPAAVPRFHSSLTSIRVSSLEVISENVESVFEVVSSELAEEVPTSPPTPPSPQESAEHRWSSSPSPKSTMSMDRVPSPTKKTQKASASQSIDSFLYMPRRIVSQASCSSDEDDDEDFAESEHKSDSEQSDWTDDFASKEDTGLFIRPPLRRVHSGEEGEALSCSTSRTQSSGDSSSFDAPIKVPQRRLSPIV